MTQSVTAPAGHRPVRLLAVAHRSDIGGTEVCFGRVLAALARDPAFELCAAFPDGGELAEQWKSLAEHIHYDGGVLPDSFDWNAYRGWLRRTLGGPARAFEQSVAGWRPDVIVSFTSVLTTPLDVAKRLGVPGVVYVREFVEPPLVRRWLWRHLSARAGRIIGISSEIVAGVEPFAPGRTRLVHDGVPLPEVQHAEMWPPANPAIAFYGGYDRRKGGELFVRMCRLVLDASPSARFAYYGMPAPGQEVFAALVRDLVGRLRLVEAFDFVETRDFSATFGRHSVVIMPSEREGLGLVALDAMSYGVPVVATRTGGLLDVVDDGVTGALVTPRTPDAFAEAVLSILKDREGVSAMGAAARRRVEERFSLEGAVDGLRAVVREVLRGPDG